jgi:hypothetical protein
VRRCGACASAASRSAYAAERLSGDSRAAHAIGLRCGCECSPASATVADGCRRGCAWARSAGGTRPSRPCGGSRSTVRASSTGAPCRCSARYPLSVPVPNTTEHARRWNRRAASASGGMCRSCSGTVHPKEAFCGAFTLRRAGRRWVCLCRILHWAVLPLR